MKFLILLLFSLSAFAQKIPHNMIAPYATGDITGLQAALDLKANLTSPALLGIPTAPTASPLNSSNQVATTKYVDDAILANSPVLDHGGLTGLLDDDHPQYHNDSRGDARYFTQAQSTANFEPKNSNIQSHISSTSNPHSVTKAQVGLSLAENTSDLGKPISTATQTALNLKENSSNKTTNFTGNTGSNTLYPTVKAIYDALVGYLASYQPLLGYTPASDQLSNLASTSINTSLLPDTDGVYSIGLSGQNWDLIAAKKLGYDGATSIDLDTRKMFDVSDKESIDFENRVLSDASSLSSVQYNVRALLDSNGVEALSWQSRYLADDGENQALDWIERRLWASDGATTVIDWSSPSGATTITQSAGDNSNKIATTAYVDNIAPTYIEHFGSGSDGNLTLTGALTLTQDMYYDTLTLGAGANLNPNGYRIFCKTLNLTNAPAGAIRGNGANGNSTTTQAGAGLIGALASNTLGGSANGGAGATGTTGVGAQAGASGSLVNSNGGASGAGGTGGNGTPNAGGAARAASTVSANVGFNRMVFDLLRGAVLISGGAGAPGGSSGGGDGVNNGRGGGGGASGARVIGIWAHTIVTGPSTPAGVIQCMGGNGGNGANGGAGNVGGGGGGGGSGGGFAYLMYAFRVGAFVANLIDCSGGLGGQGGNGFGTGTGGRGGGGGQGGRITSYNVKTATSTGVIGALGAASAVVSGISGTAGGIGGLARMGL